MLIQMITEDNQSQKSAMLKLSGNKAPGSPNVSESYNLNYGQYEQDPARVILDCLNVAIPDLIAKM